MSRITPKRRIFWMPACVTVLLHGLLLYALTVNWSSRTNAAVTPRATPRFVEAKLVRLEAPRPKPQATPDTAARQPPAATAVKSPAATTAPARPKPTPKPQTPPPAKPAEQEQTPKPEPTPDERKATRAAARAETAREELAIAMAAEDELLEAATDDQITASYIALIAHAVENSWSRPPSARNDMEAELLLQLIPTGEVVSVTLARSSGNTAFDRSAILAVEKAEQFPELQQLDARLFEQNFRRLRLRFKPEDLRY